MNPWLVPALLGLILLLLLCLLLWTMLRRDGGSALKSLGDHLQVAAHQDAERLERELRAEVQDSARGTRRPPKSQITLRSFFSA